VPGKKQTKTSTGDGPMPIHWTGHIPQAMQQHGASRKPRPDDESTTLAEQKFQSGQPNQAEDAACRWAVTPAARPSSP
jgi:hypothetical protein